MKRAQIQIGFNWILAVVGGALFLIFFALLLRSILTTSQEQAEVSSTNLIVSMIKDMSPSIGLEDDMNTARMVSFCTKAAASFKQAKGEANPISVERQAVFSPKSFDDFFIKVYAAKGPLPMGSSVSLFDKQTHIVIVKDSYQNYKVIDAQLPPELERTIIGSPSGYTEDKRKGERTEFIIFGDDSRTLPGEEGDTAIRIFGDNLEGVDKIEFYSFENGAFVKKYTQSARYIGLYSIMGAIAAQDERMYKCSMRKSIERLYYVARIAKYRANMLRDNTELGEGCRELYAELSPNEQIGSGSLGFLINSLQIILSSPAGDDPFGSYNYGAISTYFNDIKNMNRRLQNLGSCPLVY